VFVYGVPYTVLNASGASVSIDNVIMGLNYWNPSTDDIYWYTNPYLESAPTFGTDKAHFDHATYKFAGTEMYLVTRLDGPLGLNGSQELVDQALYGDRYIAANAGYYQGNA
jgi:hypothetical protein